MPGKAHSSKHSSSQFCRGNQKTYITYQETLKSYEQALRKAKHDPGVDEIPEKPRLNHYHVSDCTIEALSGVFENDKRGVIINLDELSGLILGLDQYKGKGNDREHYLELFNANSWKIDRKAGVKFIPNTGASIIGGIQPKVMPRVFNADSFDDGLLPRFLLVLSDSNELRFNRKGLDSGSLEQWARLLEWCYRIPLTEDENGFVQPVIFTLNDEALDVWVSFHNNDYGARMPFLSDRGIVFIPKLTAYYSLKFAGILHCPRAFFSNRAIENTIPLETVTHGIELTHFFTGQAMKALALYEGRTPLNEYQRRLINSLHILKDTIKHGRLSISEITQTLNSDIPEASRITPKKIGALLKGLGLETEESTGGTYYLIWEPEKITKLFSEKMSTKFTKSTITAKEEALEGEKVDKVDMVKEECKNLIRACEPHLNPIVVIALNTGMRKGEILSLKWDNVDLKHGFIPLDRTKNGERREIPINDTLRATLKGLARRLDIPYVFYDHKTAKPYLDVKRSFHMALRRSGIRDFHFHDLRHTFASHLVMGGVDLTTVKELLGHKTLTMTLRYAHLAPAHKVKAVDILDNTLNGKPTIQKLYNQVFQG